MSHIYDLHLDIIDWSSDIHQIIVAASLVQGAYNIESERHLNNTDVMESAISIGERLGFEISDHLIDTKDASYIAIVYKFKHDVPNFSKSGIISCPPKYAIAFRGTCFDPETLDRDALYDFKFIFSELHSKLSRTASALQVVEDIISISGGVEHVWLAGHSLGSLMALMVGRSIVVEKGVHVKAFLFNPPFAGYGNLKPLRHIYWYTRSVLIAGVELLVHDSKSAEENKEVFDKLKSWKPNLFVNKRDYISNGYICYFKQRKKMNKIGLGIIENIATQNSLATLVGELLGGEEHCEPIHLIPSANLTITKGSIFHPRKAHGINQWWKNWDLPIKTKSYSF